MCDTCNACGRITVCRYVYSVPTGLVPNNNVTLMSDILLIYSIHTHKLVSLGALKLALLVLAPNKLVT